MNIAVVVGGWHFPWHFYYEMSRQSVKADLYVVAHRDPDLPIVREEKAEILRHAPGRLGQLDRFLYSKYATKQELRSYGWSYMDAPNICGDWYYLNQWLEVCDNYHDYDAILSCHDDTYIRSGYLLHQLSYYSNWLILANGGCPEEPPGYVRGSFEFFKPELIDMLGGYIPLGDITLNRDGKTDSPLTKAELDPWNASCRPLRQFMIDKGITDKIQRLSPYYRVSPFVIEGERGFMHQELGSCWTLTEGLKHYPL